jgi:hypothetical protein
MGMGLLAPQHESIQASLGSINNNHSSRAKCGEPKPGKMSSLIVATCGGDLATVVTRAVVMMNAKESPVSFLSAVRH